MRYSTIIFDLDGTLINSKESVRRSFEYALKKMNYSPNPVFNTNDLIGPPILDSFQNTFGFNLEEAKQAYTYYREEYADNGQMYTAAFYQGVQETIQYLKSIGCQLGIATTKNERLSKKIITHLKTGIDEENVYGTKDDGSRSDKASLITDYLRDHGIENKSEVLMVGDTRFDIEGARKVGIDSVGVTYGFGNVDDFITNTTYMIDHFSELKQIIG